MKKYDEKEDFDNNFFCFGRTFGDWGIVIAFLYNYDNTAPSAVESFDDGQNVMLKVSQNENYAGYRFRFVLNDEEIIFDSQTNVIYASDVDGLVLGSLIACLLVILEKARVRTAIIVKG